MATVSERFPAFVLAPELPRVAVPPYVDTYVDNHLEPATAESVRSSLKRIARIWKKTDDLRAVDWTSLTLDDALRIRKALAGSFKPSSVNTSLTALRGLVKFMRNRDLIELRVATFILDELKSLSYTEPDTGIALTLDQQTLLLRHTQHDKWKHRGLRDGAVLALGLGCGLRRKEIVKLDVSDYNRLEHSLTVRKSKGRKTRVCFVRAGFEQYLDAYLKLRGTRPGPFIGKVDRSGLYLSELTVQQAHNVVKRVSGECGIPLKTHDLRRSCATDAAENDMPIELIARQLGHVSVDMTAKHYLRNGEKRLKKAMRELPPVQFTEPVVW